MTTIQELSAALIKADAAGNTDDARVLANEIRRLQTRVVETPKPVEPPKERPGFFRSMGRGVETITSSGRTALESILSPEEAALAGIARQEEIAKKYGEGLSLDRLKEIYAQEGLLPATKAVVSEIPGAIGEQIPNIAALTAGARLGAKIPGPLPVKAAGALAGMLAPSLTQQYAGDIEQQAAAQQERGEPIAIDRMRALAAAGPQAALDVGAQRLLLGRKVVESLFGKRVSELLGTGQRATAEKLANESLKATLLKGTVTGVAAEIPAEIIQSALGRWNAGQSLTDEDAQKEYAETAFQASLISPVGALGRVAERSAARTQIAEETARQEAEARAQAAPEAPPEVPPEAPPAEAAQPPAAGETDVQQAARRARAEVDFQKMVLSSLRGAPTVTEFQSVTGLSRNAARAEMDRMVDAGFLQKDEKTGRYSLVPEYSQFEFVEPGAKPRTVLKEYPTEEVVAAAPPATAPVSRRQMDMFEGVPTGPTLYGNQEGIVGTSPEAVQQQAAQDDFFRTRAENLQKEAEARAIADFNAKRDKAQADRTKVLEALKQNTSIKTIQDTLQVPYDAARKYMMGLRDAGIVEYKNNAWRLTTEPTETTTPITPKAPAAEAGPIFDQETYQKALDAVTANGKATVPVIQKATGGTRTQATAFMKDLREKKVTNSRNELITEGAPSSGAPTESGKGRRRKSAGVPIQEGTPEVGESTEPVGSGLAGADDISRGAVGGEREGAAALGNLPPTPETEKVLRKVIAADQKGAMTPEFLAQIKSELSAVTPDYPLIHSLIDAAVRPVKGTLDPKTGEGLEVEKLLPDARLRLIRNMFKRKEVEAKRAAAPEVKPPSAKEEAPAAPATETKSVDTLRSEYSSRAIDALGDEKISERSYDKIQEQLKTPTPDFKAIDAMLEGKVRGRQAATEESAARGRAAAREGKVKRGSSARDLENAADALLREGGYDAEGELRFQLARNPQVDTPEFKRWFGDSKIKSPDGTPLRMYHITSRDFTAFLPRQAGAIFVSPSYKFTNEFGERLAGARTIPVYVKASNPFDYDNPAHLKALRRKLAGGWYDYNFSKIEQGDWEVIELDGVQRAIKELGHDGFYTNEGDVKNLAVYEPTQLKSAVGNYGSFDPNNPDIRYALSETEMGIVPHEDVVKAVKEATAGWRNAPSIKVVRSIAELPEKYRTIPANARGFYAPSSRTVYVISENAPSISGAKATVFHESLGHYGLDKKFRGDLDAVLGQMYENAAMKDAASKWLRDNPDTYAHLPESKQRARAVEEVLAERSEAGPIKEAGLRGLYNRLVAFVRDWARRNGFGVTYSDNDITQILRQAHEEVLGMPIEQERMAFSFDPQLRYQLTPDEQRRQDETLIRSYANAESKKPIATKEVLARGREVMSKLTPAFRRGLFNSMNQNQLANEYEHAIPAMRTRNDLLNQKGAYLRKQMDYISEFVKDADKVLKKYSYAERQRIYDIFNKTTLEQVEVLTDTNRGWTPDKSNPLYTQFNALKPEVQNLYRKLRESYDNQAKVTLGVLHSIVGPTQRQRLEEQWKLKRLKVYLPLFRTGEHWLSYTDKNGEMVKRSFETTEERERAYREAKAEGGKDLARYHNVSHMVRSAPPTGFFGEVLGALNKAGADQSTVNSVVDAYLNLLPARSVLQMAARKREGTAGFIKDVVQAYANVAPMNAAHITNLKFNPAIDEAMEKIREEANAAAVRYEDNPEDPKGINTDVKNDLLSVVEKSHENMLNPQFNKLMDSLQHTNYVMYLGANVSTAFVALTHLPMVVYPVLSRISGFSAAGAAMARMNKYAVNYTFNKGRGIPADLMRVLTQGETDGVLGERRAEDIEEFKTSGVDRYLGYKARANAILGKTLGTADKYNREITLLASYELHRDKLMKGGMSGDALHAAAYKAAKQDVLNTVGSVFNHAGANVLRHPLGKLFFTFKQDGMHRAYLIAKAFRNAAKGESIEVRKEARAQLLGFYGMAGLLGGVSGMPLVGWGELLAQLMFEDDDETYDASEELKQAIGVLPYKGLVNYALNVNMADRVSWDGMFWRDDPVRRSQIGFVPFVMEKMLGPTVTYLGQDIPRAVDHLKNGRLQLAAESSLPKVAANAMKGLRYGIEGATTKDGLPIKQDISAYSAFMQVLGFSPADLAEIQKENSGRIGMEKKIYSARDALVTQFVMARVNGDDTEVNEVLGKMRKFSAKYPGIAIKSGDLSGALTKHYRRVAQSVNGVYMNPKLREQLIAAYPGANEDEMDTEVEDEDFVDVEE